MHEISIAGAIIDSALDAAKNNNAIRIKEIFVEVGELTALNPDQLKFIFQIITKGTIAEGAVFNIEVSKPLIKCGKCSYKGTIDVFERSHFFLPVIKCPACGDPNVDITAGRECCITKINIL